MSICFSSWREGSSSTRTTRFCMASRKRLGIDWSASPTRRSNSARCTSRLSHFRRALLLERLEIRTGVLRGASLAERLGPADAAPVQNQDVRGSRPVLWRKRGSQLLFDGLGIIGFRDAQAVGD